MRDNPPAEKGNVSSGSGASGWRILNFEAVRHPPDWLAAFTYVTLTVFILALIVMGITGMIAAFRIAYDTSTGELKERLEAAKVFFPLVIALVAGPLLIWRVITAHIQAGAARQQAETAREAHYTDLFTKAVEQLGATRDVNRYVSVIEGGDKSKRELVSETEPNLEVRLGAIYALERIAHDSKRDHWPIMEVLCAYVRQNSGKRENPPINFRDVPGGRVLDDPPLSTEDTSKLFNWLYSLSPPRIDVQAALTVVGRRSEKGRAWERETAIADRFGLEARTEYRLDLSGTNLCLAKLSGDFDRANFRGASLDRAVLDETHLHEALFEQASLIGARLVEASLVGAHFNHAHLTEAEVMGCDLRKGRFLGTHAESTEFDGSDLSDAEFSLSMLWGASFTQASLIGAKFYACNLQEANFWWARLDGINMDRSRVGEANFDDVSLYRADLSLVDGLTAKQIKAVKEADATTKLPRKLSRPPHWEGGELTQDEIEVRIRERDEWIENAISKPAGEPDDDEGPQSAEPNSSDRSDKEPKTV